MPSGHAHSAHSHLGHHVHAPADFGRAFAIGVTLNLAFAVVEALRTGAVVAIDEYRGSVLPPD